MKYGATFKDLFVTGFLTKSFFNVSQTLLPVSFLPLLSSSELSSKSL